MVLDRDTAAWLIEVLALVIILAAATGVAAAVALVIMLVAVTGVCRSDGRRNRAAFRCLRVCCWLARHRTHRARGRTSAKADQYILS